MTAKKQVPANPFVAADNEHDDGRRCSANGCPLRATIFDTVTGPPRNGRCRYHDRLVPRRWPAFTEAVIKTSLREALLLFGLPYLEPDAPRPTPLRPIKAIDFDNTATFRRLGRIDYEALEERRAIQDEGR